MLHADELTIDVDLVADLIRSQYPQYRQETLAPLAVSGSSNKLFMLGTDLLVRLPRQLSGDEAVVKESRWLPRLQPYLSVATPDVVGLGQPTAAYPVHWLITRWMPGQLATPADPGDGAPRDELARDLARFIHSLRSIPTGEPGANDECPTHYRGGSLRSHDGYARRSIRDCRKIAGLDLDLDAALQLWEAALELPEPQEPATWFHGDLVAENLLIADGRLCGVLDFGGLGAGYPCIDLHGVWELLNPREREIFRTQLGVDDSAWLRGRAWALAVALMTFPYYWTSMPDRISARLHMARAVLEDF